MVSVFPSVRWKSGRYLAGILRTATESICQFLASAELWLVLFVFFSTSSLLPQAKPLLPQVLHFPSSTLLLLFLSGPPLYLYGLKSHPASKSQLKDHFSQEAPLEPLPLTWPALIFTIHMLWYVSISFNYVPVFSSLLYLGTWQIFVQRTNVWAQDRNSGFQCARCPEDNALATTLNANIA